MVHPTHRGIWLPCCFSHHSNGEFSPWGKGIHAARAIYSFLNDQNAPSFLHGQAIHGESYKSIMLNCPICKVPKLHYQTNYLLTEGTTKPKTCNEKKRNIAFKKIKKIKKILVFSRPGNVITQKEQNLTEAKGVKPI